MKTIILAISSVLLLNLGVSTYAAAIQAKIVNNSTPAIKGESLDGETKALLYNMSATISTTRTTGTLKIKALVDFKYKCVAKYSFGTDPKNLISQNATVTVTGTDITRLHFDPIPDKKC